MLLHVSIHRAYKNYNGRHLENGLAREVPNGHNAHQPHRDGKSKEITNQTNLNEYNLL